MPKVSEEYKEERVGAILNAAKTVFIKKGYEMTTVQDILNEAKISKGGFYLYFTGKNEVFSLLEEEFNSQFFVLMDVDYNQNPWDALKSIIANAFQLLGQLNDSFYPTIFEYYLEAYRRPERRESLEMKYKDSLSKMTSIIEHGVEQGVFNPNQSSNVIARVIITYIDGVVCHAMQLGNDSMQIKDQLECLYTILGGFLGIDPNE